MIFGRPHLCPRLVGRGRRQEQHDRQPARGPRPGRVREDDGLDDSRPNSTSSTTGKAGPCSILVPRAWSGLPATRRRPGVRSAPTSTLTPTAIARSYALQMLLVDECQAVRRGTGLPQPRDRRQAGGATAAPGAGDDGRYERAQIRVRRGRLHSARARPESASAGPRAATVQRRRGRRPGRWKSSTPRRPRSSSRYSAGWAWRVARWRRSATPPTTEDPGRRRAWVLTRLGPSGACSRTGRTGATRSSADMLGRATD